MICTLNDIYKQYNKLQEHWYTKISSLRCVEDRNPPQNASDLYMKYWSYAEHCRPCTRLSGVNWWERKKKKITLTVPIGYWLFADHRSVPSFGSGFFCLNSCLTLPKQSLYTVFAIFKHGNWWFPLDITSIGIDGTPLVPGISLWPGILGYTSSGCPTFFCSSPPLLGFYWNRWGETALRQASVPTIYKQHLYNMTPYTLKYGPGLGKTLFPVLGDNRTLCMRQPDH